MAEVKKPTATVKKPVKATVKKEAKVEVKEEVKGATPAKAAAPKTEAKKAAPKKAEAKKEAPAKAAAPKAEAKKAAPKKAAATKTATKKAEAKAVINLQFAGKSFTNEELIQSCKDIWKYDMQGKDADLKSIELYVKPEESMAYYVFNGEITGSFFL